MIFLFKSILTKRCLQFFFFCKNGLIINAVGFLLYFCITSFGVKPLIAVSIIYPFFLFLSFYIHRRYTFTENRNVFTLKMFLKFILTFAIGYLLNFFLISIFHVHYQFPHSIVQISAIIIISFLLFWVNKRFVFYEV